MLNGFMRKTSRFVCKHGFIDYSASRGREDASIWTSPKSTCSRRVRLAGVVDRTPLIRSDGLSDLAGAEVHLKWENLQRTGSNKVRGALYRMSLLSSEERSRGVITTSAGKRV